MFSPPRPPHTHPRGKVSWRCTVQRGAGCGLRAARGRCDAETGSLYPTASHDQTKTGCKMASSNDTSPAVPADVYSAIRTEWLRSDQPGLARPDMPLSFHRQQNRVTAEQSRAEQSRAVQAVAGINHGPWDGLWLLSIHGRSIHHRVRDVTRAGELGAP